MSRNSGGVAGCGLPGLPPRRARTWGVRLFSLVAASFVPALAAQELTLHVDVKLVSVFVNVTDRNLSLIHILAFGSKTVTPRNLGQVVFHVAGETLGSTGKSSAQKSQMCIRDRPVECRGRTAAHHRVF